jgi:hypothetical protein
MKVDFDKIHTLLDVVLKTKDLPNLVRINQAAMTELVKLVHEAEEAEENPATTESPKLYTSAERRM